MFIILLRFSENKSHAREFMDRHNAWIKQGFDDGVFLVAGSLQPNQGGGILAHNTSLEQLYERLENDPFVAKNVVTSEILEISPAQAEEHFSFLVENR